VRGHQVAVALSQVHLAHLGPIFAKMQLEDLNSSVVPPRQHIVGSIQLTMARRTVSLMSVEQEPIDVT